MKVAQPSSKSTSIMAIPELADQVFLFKRTVRKAALKHDMYATFMAKPHEMNRLFHAYPQSVLDKTGKNILQGGTASIPSFSSITSAACSYSRRLFHSARPM
jgi:hypothetical protein